MTELENLYDFACERDIHIKNFRLSEVKKAACVHIEDYKTIVMDKPAIETSTEEAALLAEEIGHYETGALYLIKVTHNSPIARSNRMKCEAQAKRWAVDHLLPPEKIQKAIDSCSDDYEIAEYCNVPLDLLRYAFEYYHSKQIEFQPPRGVMEG